MTTTYPKSFKDLRVYQESREVSREVFNLSKADAGRLNSGLEGVGRMLHAMMGKADSFSGPPDSAFREPEGEYFGAGPTDD